MSKQKISRREFMHVGAVALAGAAAAACQAQTVVVKETVQVEKEVTKIVEKEKEVTKVVEKEVTPTALPSAFGQAPMLADQVASGALPAVEDRLPQDPLILTPLTEVGTYGGIVRATSDTAGRFGSDASVFIAVKMAFLLRLDVDCLTVAPAVASAWEMSTDAKTMTIHLRKGVKWSDGQPFTADDILFRYEDVWLNEELTPVKPYNWTWNGVMLDVVKEDDYTVILRFPQSHPLAPALHSRGFFTIDNPKHYLQKYHPRYTSKDELDAMTKDGGFEFWYQLFGKKAQYLERDEPYHPTLHTMLFKSMGVDYVEGERNPYFWMIDTEGNQLPYVDGVFSTAAPNREVSTAKLLAGEVDFYGYQASTENYPLYQENAEKGQYKALLWSSVWGAEAGFGANQTYTKDTVLRDIFRDKRFRIALSLGMDRDEINTTLYFGKATPRQLTVLPSSRYFEPEFEKAFVEFNPDEANKLLDEMGLDKKDSEGYRLRSDGQRLTWQIDYPQGSERPREVVAQLVIEQWRQNLGIEVTLKEYSGDLMATRVQANDIQMNLGDCDNAMDIMFILTPYWSVPMNWGWEWCWNSLWGNWYQTNGKEGEEPPQEQKDLLTTWEQMKATLDEDERTRLGKVILKAQAENLWCIGSVGLAPVPICVASNLVNIPEDQLWGWDCFFASIFGSPAWYFKQPLLDRQKG